MIRITLLFLLLSSSLSVQAEDENSASNTLSIGLGPYFQTQPYEGATTLVTPTPVVFYDNRVVYVRWTRVGLYLAGGENWGYSITAQPRPYGYSASDSDGLTGMAARESGWEAGFALAGKNQHGFAEVMLLSDITARSNGSLARLELGKIVNAGRWTLVPSFMAIYFDGAFNDYYYGVTVDEETATRPAYSAGQGLNYALQTFANYQLTSELSLQGNLRVDYLNKTISDSPIVDNDWMVSAMLSLAYSLD
ncbi:MAG: MipA/OmpV family protein [Candidatus Polarisedimenticolaceae bacterium]|nr:MipA/OmpV family protein [Candidatus Polarisedimenticolaceae bacterium]